MPPPNQVGLPTPRRKEIIRLFGNCVRNYFPKIAGDSLDYCNFLGIASAIAVKGKNRIRDGGIDAT